MKRVKSIIVLLIITITMNLVVNVNAANTIVSDNDKQSSLAHMEALGVMSKLANSSAEQNKAISRSEFSKMLMVIAGKQELVSSLKGQTIYPDVKANDSMSGYINAAVNCGYLTGMVDRKFHPNENITFAQLCTAVVKMLGYTDSDLSGIIPDNYIEKAKSLKLIDNISLSSGQAVPRWVAAVIMDRLLSTNIKKTNQQATDVTLMDSVGDFADVVILGTPKTLTSLDNNQVMTDKGIYYIDSDPNTLQVGNKYRVYVDQTASKIDKVYYGFKTVKTYSVAASSGNTISYKDNGVVKSMVLPDKVSYYYNGTKLQYSSLASNLHLATTVIFANNDNKVGYDYAIVVDPVYSTAVIANNVKANTQKVGNISVDKDEKILKNGDYIKLSDIQNNDVVYQVSDINGDNKFIYVVDNKIQGVLTGILPNRLNPSTIQLDGKSYDVSKDMNLSKITDTNSTYKIGDTVQLMSGYDGKITDIAKNIAISTATECVILGNSDTVSSLDDNQILTDKGTYYLSDTKLKLELGVKYKLNISDDKILGSQGAENKAQSFVVNDLTNSKISYTTNGKTGSMTLPSNVTYYYQGTKQTYDNLKNVIQGDTTIIFGDDQNNLGYDYAIIIDPIYSKPEVAGDSMTDGKIGSITIASGEKIVKNGDYISQRDIQTNDVVYEVSDLNNTNKYIYVLNSMTQGVLTGILPNRIYPKTIQIDSKSYDLSKDMKMNKITDANSDYKIGDTIQLISGYDGKIVDVTKNAVMGSYVDCVILGNSKTISSLTDNQILTDKGTYYLANNNLNLQLGVKYKLYVTTDNKITASQSSENTISSIVVNNTSNISNSKVSYLADGTSKTMTLPDNTTYYYQGVKQNYDNIKNLIQGDTTIIFANNSAKTGYDYALIIDPIYSKPVIANNVKIQNKNIGGIDLTEWKSVIRNGDYISPYDITDGELVYQVSDIGGTNKYLLVVDGIVTGELTAILPNRISPTIIQIAGKNYNISNDMDLSKLVNKSSVFKIGDTVQITLGYDGKVANLDYPVGQDNANFAYVLNSSTTYVNGSPVYKVSIIKADGTTGDYKSYTDATYMKGYLVTFTNVDDTTLMLNPLQGQSYSEITMNKDNLKFGDYYGTSNLRIFDVVSNISGSDAKVKVLQPSELYSGKVASGKVWYMNHINDFGDVNVLVLNDINEDAASYGLVKSATATVSGSGPRKSTTFSYTIDVNGKDYQWTTQTDYSISALGIVGVDVSTGQVATYYGVILPEASATNIQALSTDKIKLSDKIYQFRNDTVVYYRDSSGNITTTTTDKVDITKTYANVLVYLDKPLDYNGKVKAIYISEQ